MTATQQAIDAAIEAAQDTGFRSHLGGSMIGRECAREVWYGFRWFKRSRHEARLLRLFDRGNLEEARFVEWLRAAGVHVEEVDPETGKQWRVSDHAGHFGGSLDALLRGLPDWSDPDDELLGEFKTHNDKSFQKLKKEGVAGAKWEHYVQMQVYMHLAELPAALYMAINKNDDELYTELVEYNPEVASEYIHRAWKIINTNEPPDRINESPGWYKCKWCGYSDVCHYNAPVEPNCRNCAHATATLDGEGSWLCRRYNYPLSKEEQLRGCTEHRPI